MATATEPRRPRGRPRDPSADARILTATRELVSELGVRAVSMSAIAERAGVGKPTIYLRWPNFAALVLAAVHDVPTTARTLDRFSAAVAALAALGREPEGQFLIETLVLPSAAAFIDDAAEAERAAA